MKGNTGRNARKLDSNLTPVPSSDVFEETEEIGMRETKKTRGGYGSRDEGLPSPITSTENGSTTPSRRVSYLTRLFNWRKVLKY